MNVQCTHCSTVFRVDPRKVPATGVRVRCSICRGVFELAGTEASAAPPAAASPEPVAAPAPAPQPTPSPAPAVDPAQPTPAVASAPAPQPTPAAAPTPAPAPQPTPPSAPAPAAPTPRPAPAAPAASAPRSPFGAADPNAKARRLARALVSDIVTYHPERRDQALASGTLKKEFLEEIKKSWEEYVGQVGQDTAKSTPHFRDALNDILAKGQQLF